jgi:hypothetical protein
MPFQTGSYGAPLDVVDVALKPGVELLIGLGVVYKPQVILELADRIAACAAGELISTGLTPTASPVNA